MELKARLCPICGSIEVVEKNGCFYCKSCGVTFDKTINRESEEEKRQYFLQQNAETELSVSPPRFDTALSNYELLIKEFPNWSTGYWGYLRARYGIKYERDTNDKAIPCCYEGEYQDFRNDTYYKKALELAETPELKAKYESEAERIAKTWKEWSEKAKRYDYDVFISFKATDENGQPTSDLIDATNLNAFLVGQGFKVFFSPISMKEHAGEPYYDAYIYNALEKAEVLIVYGSKSDYFKTTWIQNEWTRYLKQISEGKKQINSLFIVYKDFNPSNELPTILVKRQMIDGSSRNLYTEITNSIKKILANSKKKEVIEHISVDQVEQSKKIDKKSNIELVTLNSGKKSKEIIGKKTGVHSKELTNEGSGLYTPTINDKLSVARTCLEAERYEEALAFYNDVIKDDPGNGQALIGSFATMQKQKEILQYVNGEIKEPAFLPIEQVKEFNEIENSIAQTIECADNKKMAERILLWVYYSYVERGFNNRLTRVYSSAFDLINKYNCLARAKAIKLFSDHVSNIYIHFNDYKRATKFLLNVSKTFPNDAREGYLRFLRDMAGYLKRKDDDEFVKIIKLLIQGGEASYNNVCQLVFAGHECDEFYAKLITAPSLELANQVIKDIKENIVYLEKDDAEKVLVLVSDIIDRLLKYIKDHISESDFVELKKSIKAFYFYVYQYKFKERDHLIHSLKTNLDRIYKQLPASEYHEFLDFSISVIENDAGDADYHIKALSKLGTLYLNVYQFERTIFQKIFEYQENNFKGLCGTYICDTFSDPSKLKPINKEELEDVLKYASDEKEQQEFIKYLLDMFVCNNGYVSECIDEMVGSFDLLIKYCADNQAHYVSQFALILLNRRYYEKEKYKKVIENYMELSLRLMPRRNIEARLLALLIKCNANSVPYLENECMNFTKNTEEYKELIFACADDKESLLKYTKMADRIEKRIEKKKKDEELEKELKIQRELFEQQQEKERVHNAWSIIIGIIAIICNVLGIIWNNISFMSSCDDTNSILWLLFLLLIGLAHFSVWNIKFILGDDAIDGNGISIIGSAIGAIVSGICALFDNFLSEYHIIALVMFIAAIFVSSFHIFLKKKVFKCKENALKKQKRSNTL